LKECCFNKYIRNKYFFLGESFVSLDNFSLCIYTLFVIKSYSTDVILQWLAVIPAASIMHCMVSRSIIYLQLIILAIIINDSSSSLNKILETYFVQSLIEKLLNFEYQYMTFFIPSI